MLHQHPQVPTRVMLQQRDHRSRPMQVMERVRKLLILPVELPVTLLFMPPPPLLGLAEDGEIGVRAELVYTVRYGRLPGSADMVRQLVKKLMWIGGGEVASEVPAG